MTRRSLALTAAAAAFLLVAAPGARADETAKPGAAATDAGVVFEKGTPPFADVLAKSKATGKAAFIDFSTSWCGWCRKLEKDTFSQASVADVMKGFINVQVDAEKGEGIELAKRYGVKTFPTLVVVDEKGEEIDRINGYMPPETFIPAMQRIARGENTLPTLRKRVAEAPDDLSAATDLAVRSTVANLEQGVDALKALVARAKGGEDRNTEAKIRLEYAAALLRKGDGKAAVTEAEVLVRDFCDAPAAGQAAGRLSKAIVAEDLPRGLAFVDAARLAAHEEKDRVAVEQLAFSIHRKGISESFKVRAQAAGDDPHMLNAVAWDAFEQKLLLKDAVVWARKAVEKAPDSADILDTLANLLWATGGKDEAVKIETDALAKADPAKKRDFELVLARWQAETAVNAKNAPAK